MSNVEVCPKSAKKPVPLLSPEAAFARFYREHRGFVRSALLKHGRVEEREVDDLVQEVFLVAWQRWGGLVEGEQTRAWLFTVALYRAANHRKLARNRWESLPGELPEPLLGYEVHGRSMLEIARALGIRLKTAYARLRLARNRLALSTTR